MDGDLAWNIVPSNDVQLILDRPFGIEAFFQGKVYVNPNRYVCHKSLQLYMKNVPLFLQNFVKPIDSPYLAAAIFKTLLQLGIILILSLTIYITLNRKKEVFILSLVILSPFFQTNGYQNYMGIIDPSITYTFFYAFPIFLLLIYFYPLFKLSFLNKELNRPKIVYFIWIPLSFIVCLSGPLNPGVILIFSLLFIIHQFKKAKIENSSENFLKISRDVFYNTNKIIWFILIPANLLSVYSLHIGTFNLSSHLNDFPLLELYKRIPSGLYYIYTQKLGNGVLLFLFILNYTLLIKLKKEDTSLSKYIQWINYSLVFCVLYILLLPLGGYRIYRENVIRYDTFLPITILFVFTVSLISILLFQIKFFWRKIYYSISVLIILIYTFADSPKFNENKSEKLALKEMKDSDDKNVVIKQNCQVFSWWKYTSFEESELNAELMYFWKITKDKKLYKNQP